MSANETPNLLLLRNGVFMSMQDITVGKYQLLSQEFTGDILEKVYRPELERFTVGRFNFIGMHIEGITRNSGLVGSLLFGFFVVYHALRRHWFHRRYDYVITYDPFAAGVLGLILSFLLGARLVCEVNGNYGEKKTWLGPERRLLGLIKYYYCRVVIPVVINRTFATKLLYAAQLRPFGTRIKNTNLHVFHEYTPVLTQKFQSTRGNYLLFMGNPWDVKGVDVLIKAYRGISGQFPHHVLRIVGWFPEPGLSYLKQLAGDDPAIQLCRAVKYEEAMTLMAGAYAVVLPSRTEGMGRVLLEGMAYGKPVIASRVDGIPTYVKPEVNGLLAEPENVADLAAQIVRVLGDAAYAEDLGARSREYVRAHLSEDSYLRYYREMLAGGAGGVKV
jgi:glycosyltransferase involved in cell wall biosynthesis